MLQGLVIVDNTYESDHPCHSTPSVTDGIRDVSAGESKTVVRRRRRASSGSYDDDC